jgi:hypothetical protein
MDEARAIINVKEGTIELQGPVDFVRFYLNRYQPAITVNQAVTKGNEELPVITEPSPEKKPAAPIERSTCIGAIRGFITSGFFNQRRSFADVRKHLSEGGFVCREKTIRAGLSRLAKTDVLNTIGKGRGLRYTRP